MTRRQLLLASASTASGAGILAPDATGPFALGEALNYATHRLITGSSLAREFPRSAISAKPFANRKGGLEGDAFAQHQAAGFANWRLKVEGLIEKPASLSLADLRAIPSRSQITQLTCEEGWSYIAEWTGVPVAHVLEQLRVKPEARYVVYYSLEKGVWDSVDLDEALHPQTLLVHTFNGADLPVPHGGPLRFRVPRQLGYKSLKFVDRLLITDSLEKVENGRGSNSFDFGYAWFAGI